MLVVVLFIFPIFFGCLSESLLLLWLRETLEVKISKLWKYSRVCLCACILLAVKERKDPGIDDIYFTMVSERRTLASDIVCDSYESESC